MLAVPHHWTNDVVLGAVSNVFVGLVFWAKPAAVEPASASAASADCIRWFIFVLSFIYGVSVISGWVLWTTANGVFYWCYVMQFSGKLLFYGLMCLTIDCLE